VRPFPTEISLSHVSPASVSVILFVIEPSFVALSVNVVAPYVTVPVPASTKVIVPAALVYPATLAAATLLVNAPFRNVMVRAETFCADV
jgi:hypothetical protein